MTKPPARKSQARARTVEPERSLVETPFVMPENLYDFLRRPRESKKREATPELLNSAYADAVVVLSNYMNAGFDLLFEWLNRALISAALMLALDLTTPISLLGWSFVFGTVFGSMTLFRLIPPSMRVSGYIKYAKLHDPVATKLRWVSYGLAFLVAVIITLPTALAINVTVRPIANKLHADKVFGEWVGSLLPYSEKAGPK